MANSEKFWDGRAKEYDRNESKYSRMYSKTIQNTKKYLNPTDSVLDYGCGTGLITNEMSECVHEIHAIDISSKMIKTAVSKARDLGINNIYYEQSDIFNIELKQESYDVILAFNVLHLIEDNAASIERIDSLLRPGGCFISTTACLREKKSVFSTLLILLNIFKISPYMHRYKVSELENLISNGNFQILESETFEHVAPVHYIAARKPEIV